MRFAPEYVSNVLNDNFEDAKVLLLAPLMSIHYAHLVMLTERRIISRDDARTLRHALDGISIDAVKEVEFDPACEDLFFYLERLIAQGAGEQVAGRLHTARSRNDIDMTMYRIRQREFISGMAEATLTLRRALLELAAQHTHTIYGAHTHTQPAQVSTIAHYLLGVIEQLERDAKRLESSYRSTNQNPLGACAITGTGFPIDRHRTSELLGFDGPTGNTYGSIATVDYLLESVSATAICRDRAGPRGAGPAAVGDDGVRLPAARRRLRAVEQHHAAEAQSGGPRARPRHRQQGGRPGPGNHDHGAQHAVR